MVPFLFCQFPVKPVGLNGFTDCGGSHSPSLKGISDLAVAVLNDLNAGEPFPRFNLSKQDTHAPEVLAQNFRELSYPRWVIGFKDDYC